LKQCTDEPLSFLFKKEKKDPREKEKKKKKRTVSYKSLKRFGIPKPFGLCRTEKEKSLLFSFGKREKNPREEKRKRKRNPRERERKKIKKF